MNIIVVGAGKVGYTVAEVLSPNNEIMVIESNGVIAEKAKSMLNISLFNENGSNPVVLQEAITRHQADAIVCTTPDDDTNIFISMVSKNIKPDIKTVARIRNPDYLRNTLDFVDQIFAPEFLSANIISKLTLMENATEYESIDNIGMGIATFVVRKEHTNIVGKVILALDMPADTTVVAIYRGKDIIFDNETVELHIDDRICVIGSDGGLIKFNEMMGVVRQAEEFVILGASISGIELAKILESHKRYVKIIEPDPDICRKLARQFSSVIVVNGNPVDPHLLKMENVGRADVLIALGTSDETNLLASLMGLKLGSGKIISTFSMLEYKDIFDFTGIQSAIGYQRIVTNLITKSLLTAEEAPLKLRVEGEYYFTISINDKSPVLNKRLGDIDLPPGCRIGCIVRDEKIVYPRMDTQYLENDRVLMFTYNVKISKLEKLFKAGLHFSV